jgi:hypothetical protein
MKTTRFLIAGVLAASAVAVAFAQANLVQFMPDQIKWASTAPGVTKDTQTAALGGPLDKAVPYIQNVYASPIENTG